MDISGKLAQANGRLKAANVGVTIEQRGDRLLLRAVFPPRPGSNKKQAYQQRLSLGVKANPAGLKEAEQEARKIGALLNCREFDWTPYLREPNPLPQSIQEWVERYHQHYLGNDGTQATWEGDYWKIYRLLPQDASLSQGVLEACILNLPANTKSRARAVRVYGVMATYGLRNHEVFYLNLDRFPIIEVLEGTKTGARAVFPCYSEWAKEWNLDHRILPSVNLNRSNDRIGHSVSHYLSPKLPFTPYDLRHAWAVRTLGWFPIKVAARQMGHGIAIHEQTYHRWITTKHYQKMYDLLMNREDRPKPPGFS